MKLNIEITKKSTGIFETANKIAEIKICNGHWKYWDDMMESDEEISLTINNIHKTYYLNYPVKDEYKMHDFKLYEETGELKVSDVSVRTYDNLLSYLNYRIGNVKEDYKSGSYQAMGYDEEGGVTFEAFIYEEDSGLHKENSIDREIIHKYEGKLIVKIEVIQ